MHCNWVPCNNIIKNQLRFKDRNVNIGNNGNYCLVMDNDKQNLDSELFSDCVILDNVYQNNIMYVLVEVISLEKAQQLHNKFTFKAMTTLPDFYNSYTYETISYIITVKIKQSDDIYKFSQILPKS